MPPTACTPLLYAVSGFASMRASHRSHLLAIASEALLLSKIHGPVVLATTVVVVAVRYRLRARALVDVVILLPASTAAVFAPRLSRHLT